MAFRRQAHPLLIVSTVMLVTGGVTTVAGMAWSRGQGRAASAVPPTASETP